MLEAAEHAEQRGLAAARRPEQREEGVARDAEADLVHGGHPAVALADVFDLDDRWGVGGCGVEVSHPSVAASLPGRCQRTAMMVSTTVTAISTVDAALTSGVAPKRTME